MTDYLTMIGDPFGDAATPTPPANVWGIADYLASETSRLGAGVPWNLPGLANLRPLGSLGYLFQNASADPRKYLQALAEAEENSTVEWAFVGDSYRKPTNLLVDMVGKGSGTFDWPDEVKRTMQWVWGEGQYAGSMQEDIRTESPLPMARLWINYHAATAAANAKAAGGNVQQQEQAWKDAALDAGNFAMQANANTSATRSAVLREQQSSDVVQWLDDKVREAATNLPSAIGDPLGTVKTVAIGAAVVVGGLVLLRMLRRGR